MLKTFIGTKIGMSQVFNENGERVPVTVLSVKPLTVIQHKSKATDGYEAIQVGLEFGAVKNPNKPLVGHLKKAGLGTTKPRFLRELVLEGSEDETFEVGKQVDISTVFAVGDAVSVTAVAKSKGFQGPVKRHGFAGGPRTHGQSDRERAPGSLGQTTTPGRVYKGKRMAGRMGGLNATSLGVQIVAIDAEKQIMHVSGVVPGSKKMPVVIKKQ